MAQTFAARRGVLETLQIAGSTTGNGNILAIPVSMTKHSFIIKPDSGVFSAGKVFCEASDDPTFAGTWQAVGTEQTLVSNTEVKVSYDGALLFVRARISATITGGGTVSAFYYGSAG